MVYVVWLVFSWICKSLSQTDPGIQHKRFNTTYHWPIGPRLRRIILKQAGSARSQGAKGGSQWLDREGFLFKKRSFSHWLAARIGKCGPTVYWQSVLFVAFAFCLHLQASWVDFEWITLSHIHLDARSQQLTGLQSQQVFFNKQPLGSEKMGCREAVPLCQV